MPCLPNALARVVRNMYPLLCPPHVASYGSSLSFLGNIMCGILIPGLPGTCRTFIRVENNSSDTQQILLT